MSSVVSEEAEAGRGDPPPEQHGRGQVNQPPPHHAPFGPPPLAQDGGAGVVVAVDPHQQQQHGHFHDGANGGGGGSGGVEQSIAIARYYEAQMRDHAAAYATAAAGAAWAAARIAAEGAAVAASSSDNAEASALAAEQAHQAARSASAAAAASTALPPPPSSTVGGFGQLALMAPPFHPLPPSMPSSAALGGPPPQHMQGHLPQQPQQHYPPGVGIYAPWDAPLAPHLQQYQQHAASAAAEPHLSSYRRDIHEEDKDDSDDDDDDRLRRLSSGHNNKRPQRMSMPGGFALRGERRGRGGNDGRHDDDHPNFCHRDGAAQPMAIESRLGAAAVAGANKKQKRPRRGGYEEDDSRPRYDNHDAPLRHGTVGDAQMYHQPAAHISGYHHQDPSTFAAAGHGQLQQRTLWQPPREGDRSSHQEGTNKPFKKRSQRASHHRHPGDSASRGSGQSGEHGHDHPRGRRRKVNGTALARGGPGDSSECGGAGPHNRSESGGANKRGYHGSSSAASGGKKKSPRSHGHHGGPKPFNPVGKTGVSALHELCDKQHWDAPQFVEVDSRMGESATGPPLHLSHSHEFVISVIVNNQELGRGRGGTKASAKQDASRRALSVLVPGIVFDTNGILLRVGKGFNSQAVMDDLAPNLASRLAIRGKVPKDDSRPSSPDPSEDSSISTAVSLKAVASSAGQPIVSGGPCKQPRRPLNIYPCASTTSGISSASENDDNDDAYYATRGASVCSTLLFAMWQIDSRIREPPSYSFEVCPNPAVVAAHSSSKRKCADSLIGASPVTAHRASFACTASLILYNNLVEKVTGSNHDDKCRPEGSGNSQDGTGSESNVRNSSDDKASLEGDVSKTPQHYATVDATLPGEQENCNQECAQRLEATETGATKREAKHKASAKLLTLLFPDCNGMVEVKAAAEAARERYAASKALSKHSKRAMNSSLLRKERNSSQKTSGIDCSKYQSDTRLAFALPVEVDPPLPPSQMHVIGSLAQFDVANITFNKALHSAERSRSRSSSGVDGLFSVAGLTLSESAAENKKNADPGSHQQRSVNAEGPSLRSASRQKQLEEEVDSVLQGLHDLEEEGRSSIRDVSIDDVGKTILRRAGPNDCEWIKKLFSRSSSSREKKGGCSDSNGPFRSIGPLSLIGLSSLHNGVTVDAFNCSECLANVSLRLWGGMSVILLLSRAVATYDEPPLGCAVLTLGFSLDKGRMLRICELAHEEHLPRERFLECLQVFSSRMKCGLDDSAIESSKECTAEQDSKSVLSFEDMKRLVDSYKGLANDGDKITLKKSLQESAACPGDSRGGNEINVPQHLQSVKEEDGDEEDGASEDKDGDESGAAGRPQNQDKPSKRTRVA